MSTIKINELVTESISLSDFLAKADSDGFMSKTTVQNMSNFLASTGTLGLRGVLLSTDATVTEDGIYLAGDAGTYTNNGGLVITVNDKITLISVTGTQTVFSKAEFPINITFDDVPTFGSENTVKSNGVKLGLEAKNKVLRDVFDLVRTSNNMFDKSSVTPDTIVSPSTGELLAQPNYSSSDYITIKPNKNYISKHVAFGGAWYDDEKVFISGAGTTNTDFLSPVNARYFRLGMTDAQLDTQQFNEGTVLLTYDDYFIKLGYKIKFDEENFPTDIDYLLKEKRRLYSLSDAIVEWGLGNKFPLAFFGDSTTDGATVTGYVANVIGTDHIQTNAFPYLLQEKLKTYTSNTTLRIYNAGFSGFNTVTGLANIDAIFLNANYQDVKMIGISYGINDRGGSIEDYKLNLKKICLWCYDNGYQPFLITPQTILQDYITGNESQSSNFLTSRIVPAMRSIADTFNLEILDNNSETTNFLAYSKVIKSSIIPDALHFTDRGHQFEAESYFSQLIGDAIEVKDANYFISCVEPKLRNTYYFGYITVDYGSDKKERYANINSSNWSSGDLVVKLYLMNSAKDQLNLNLNVGDTNNFTYTVNGVSKTGAEVTELEIGMHEIEVFANNSVNRKFYGLNITS
jgi:hypothetical protein